MGTENDINLTNLFSLYQKIGSGYKESEVFGFDDFKVVRTIGSPWPNTAYSIEEHKITESVIAAIGSEMKDLQMMPAIILNYIPGMLDVLKPQGFMPVEQWTGMSRTGIRTKPPVAASAGVSISLINDQEGTKSWTDIVSRVLFGGKYLDCGIFGLLRSEGAELIGISIGNEPVGSLMLYFDENGIPGIYMVCVKADHRGKGLARLIVGYCLDRLKQNNIDTCYLQSTKMGLGLYKALGFQESVKYVTCCKIK
jgi:GNAT superfamily N-acetyltransferase